jgi:hypothetical protein
VQYRGSPSYPGSVANAFYLMYGMMDLSVLPNRLIRLLGLLGLLVGAIVAGYVLRRGGIRQAFSAASGVALPLMAPLLVAGGAAFVAFGAHLWGFPIRGPGGILGPLESNLNETYTRIANEDYSAYGPLGVVALLAASALTILAYARRRVDARHLALAATLPLFLVFISLESTWHPFLIRFFLLPAVLAAPLLARLLRGRLTTAAYLLVAAVTVGLTITHDQPKPLDNPYGFGSPWQLTQVTALATNSDSYAGNALAAYQKLVPPRACVGAILGTNEPSYLLFGPHFEHHVFYLSVNDPLRPAYRQGLFYVVITTGTNASAADTFKAAGWRIQPLAGYWQLASDPNASTGECTV